MRQSALAAPADLLERERDVERIRAVVDAAEQGRGATLVVEGAPGIGKSRLLEEARACAADLNVRVLEARAIELEQGFPFGIVRQLFERPLLEADLDTRERWLSGAAALSAELLSGLAGSAPATSGPPPGDPGYAWQHGLYWLASNISAESPLVLLVDDLQWCDAPSASTLAFIARRLEGQPLALIVATRPLDPALTAEAATIVADRATVLVRPAPLTNDAVRAFVAARLSGDADESFVRACVEVTGGNPFFLGELLDEAAARGLAPTAGAAAEVAGIVPRGVANAVLLRLARVAPGSATLARALSVLGDGAQPRTAASVAGLSSAELEAAMAELVLAGVVKQGATVRFAHPILRTTVYEDLSPAERERLHRTATAILRARGASAVRIAPHVMQAEPAGDLEAVATLRAAAREVLALGDPTAAAALLSRALDEPPADGDRRAIVLELGQALARAGAPEGIARLSEIVENSEDPAAIAAAAIALSGMLFFAGRGAEGAPILREARERLSPEEPAREQLEVALLGASHTSASAWREAGPALTARRDPGGPARSVLEATTLATLAMDEAMYLGSASSTIDLAKRALAADLPHELHSGENWAGLALAALLLADDLDAALGGTDEILTHARERGAALTVVSLGALRAMIELRRGNLAVAQADAHAAIELAPDLLGANFLVLAVAAAVLAGLDRGETPDSLRRLIDRSGMSYDKEFMPSAQLRYASAVLRAAAGNHEAAIDEFHACGLDPPIFGGENPSVVPWRSAAALSLAELGRHEEARELVADEVHRARSFGAPRAIGIALRMQAIVGPAEGRLQRLAEARDVLAESPARLEQGRVLVDIGATLRAAGTRRAARDPLLEGLALAARCGARPLERRARAELAAIGVRPRTTEHAGADSLTPSERRVVELAAAGGRNREIAQTLFVTEKTVETHLGHAFRKLDVTSRRQLPDVLARAAG